jgi:hypothetical protein
MRHKRKKGYWRKKAECFSDGAAATSRAATLKTHEPVAAVCADRKGDEYVVSCSVAKWYQEQLKKAAIGCDVNNAVPTAEAPIGHPPAR